MAALDLALAQKTNEQQLLEERSTMKSSLIIAGVLGLGLSTAAVAQTTTYQSTTPSAPGTNALVTSGATNGNSIGATTGGPSQANGIPGTPNGISSQTGSNSDGGGGGGSGGSGSGSGSSR